MGWEAWLTLAVIGVLMVGLARNWAGPDLLVMAALTFLVLVGELRDTEELPDPASAVREFGNPGLIVVGVLYVVVAGLVQTGAMAMITQPLIGRPRTVARAQLRLLLPVATLSAFLNNTPVVALFMPVVDDICKKTRISPSKLFMPLAFTATFGGVCSLIGTSTNLLVTGWMAANLAPPPVMGLFEIAKVGLPCAIAGVVYLVVFTRWLLPDRRPAISLSEDPRQYTVEVIVDSGGPLVGRTIEDAGLRHLPGLYLVEIERQGTILPAVGPRERLQGEDRLVFVGVVDSVVDLRRMRGLSPATNQVFKLNAPETFRSMVEAVVSDRCPIVGKTIREGQFRSAYNAAVIAVARGGKRIRGKIGDIVLQAGDTLLLETDRAFAQRQRNSRDFFLVSNVENSSPPRHGKAWLALAILAGLVVSVALEWIDILTGALVAGGLMIVTRCCTGGEARQSVDWTVLVVIGGALGLGSALQMSGAADGVARQLIGLAGGSPWLSLFMIYAVTLLFTELVTNNAAAAVVLPIAYAAATSLGVNFIPFAIAIMIAASAGFATPIGYQTHLMVYGPGGYQFSDYVRLGLPLDLLFMAITVTLAPFIWPF